MLTLAAFLYRLGFGLALGMAVTSPRHVTGGYYKNHSLVLVAAGLLSLLSTWGIDGAAPLFVPILATILSYLAFVSWWAEKAGPGLLLLALAAAAFLYGAVETPVVAPASSDLSGVAIHGLDSLSSGLLIGSALAAMLLGHWYLNAPGMRLAPLNRLVILLAGAAVLRGLLAAVMLVWYGGPPGDHLMLVLLAIRWLFGLLGILGLAWMTRQTLRIPNTQSATGILYVCVIGVFLGELASLLLLKSTNGGLL